jgi:hypothetical protein
MSYARLWLLSVVVLSPSSRAIAQTPGTAPAKSAPAPTSVTLPMDWTRGDRYYGFHYIQLSSPCQTPSEQKCECTVQFREMSSKDNAAEFADYVSSFDHSKVPVTFRLSYAPDGVFSGARMMSVGTWKSEAFPPNDILLAVKISFSRGAPGQVKQRAKINSPADCFRDSASGRAAESPESTPKPH